eukprot:COSAG04_NODE_270_length_18507_cov_125.250380_4_plen_252_part_00
MAHASDHSLLSHFDSDSLPHIWLTRSCWLSCVLQEQTAQSEAREQAELLRRTRAEEGKFGLNFRDSDRGIVIGQVVKGGNAERDGRVKPGAKVLAIEGDGVVTSLDGVSFADLEKMPAWEKRPTTFTFQNRKETVAAQLLYAYKAQMIKRILDGGHGRVALSDTLAGQTTPDGRLIVDSATLFLSHAWMMETGEFLDVTIANMDEEDYAWIDIFVYPQFSEGDGSTGAWIKRFDNMIVGIGKVVRAAALRD